MYLNFFTAFIFLFTSLSLTIWYKFFYQPQKKLQALIAQGARKADFKPNPVDDFGGLKKAIQEDPEIKAAVRKLPGKVFVSFIDPNLIKEVLTNHNYYDKLNKTSELSKLLTSKSIIIADGAEWKVHRMLLTEAFQYSFFKDMIPTIIETADKIIGISSRKEKTIQLPDVTELITSDVATKTFFGVASANIDVNGQKAPEELSYIVMKMMSYSLSPLRFFPGMWALNFYKDYRDLKRRIRNFRQIFTELVEKRMERITQQTEHYKKETDILEILLEHRHKYGDDPSKTLSNHEIIDDFFIFSVAGKDTTSSLISMALYSCEKFPEWGAKLKEEVNRTITTPEEITLDLINSMTYMSAFINEVLRVFPPVPVLLPRIANRDHYVGQIFIEKGTLINTSLLASNYSPKFFDEPEEFNPTRWLKSNTKAEGWRTNPFSYVPFSGGARNCIGKHFALIEARVILSLILKYYDISLAPEFQLKVGQIGVSYLPKESIPLKLVPK